MKKDTVGRIAIALGLMGAEYLKNKVVEMNNNDLSQQAGSPIVPDEPSLYELALLEEVRIAEEAFYNRLGESEDRVNDATLRGLKDHLDNAIRAYEEAKRNRMEQELQRIQQEMILDHNITKDIYRNMRV